MELVKLGKLMLDLTNPHTLYLNKAEIAKVVACAAAGDVDAVTDALRSIMHPRTLDAAISLGVANAVQHGHVKVLEVACLPVATQDHKCLALCLAAHIGAVEIMDYLLGAVSFSATQVQESLEIAATAGHEPSIRVLLARFPGLDTSEAMYLAQCWSRRACVKTLKASLLP